MCDDGLISESEGTNREIPAAFVFLGKRADLEAPYGLN